MKFFYQTQQIKVVRIGEPVAVDGAAMDNPELVAAYWFAHVAAAQWYDADKEHLVALLLNTKLRPIGFHLVSVGSLNESIAHPREILRPAIAASAYGFVMMHNHPSGDSSPSQADQRLTRKIRECGELLQIPMLDHVIVGRVPIDGRFSFREAGTV